MLVKLIVSALTLFVTTLIMSEAYEGELGLKFIRNFFSSKDGMVYPFLIQFLFVSHFVLATYYFFTLRKKIATLDLRRLIFAIALGGLAYGSYLNLSSMTGKSVFTIIRYQMGYFHIFYDDLKLFFRLDSSSSKAFFILSFASLILIFIMSYFVFFGGQFILIVKVLGIAVLCLLATFFVIRRPKVFGTSYFVFVLVFVSAPLALIVDYATFEKLGVFYFCYHVMQCYFFFPASQLLKERRASIGPILKFFSVVLIIHAVYLFLGHLGTQLSIIPFQGDSVMSMQFFSKNWEVSNAQFMNYPFILLFDVYAYKFWGVFHIVHCFLYDRLLLRHYFEI